MQRRLPVHTWTFNESTRTHELATDNGTWSVGSDRDGTFSVYRPDGSLYTYTRHRETRSKSFKSLNSAKVFAEVRAFSPKRTGRKPMGGKLVSVRLSESEIAGLQTLRPGVGVREIIHALVKDALRPPVETAQEPV